MIVVPDHLVPVPGLLLQTGLRDGQQGQSRPETRRDSDRTVAADVLHFGALVALAARLE